MAKKGEAARALSAAFASSLFGGLVGVLFLTFFILIALPIVLEFRTPELLMITIFGLSMVGILTGANLWKGLAACSLGLLLGALGAAPLSGVQRATFGTEYLLDPLPLVVVGLAMFERHCEVAEIVYKATQGRQGGVGLAVTDRVGTAVDQGHHLTGIASHRAPCRLQGL